MALKITETHTAFLLGMAKLHDAGHSQPSPLQVQIATHYLTKPPGFNKNLTHLKKCQYIRQLGSGKDKRYEVTKKGWDLVRETGKETSFDLEDYHRSICEVFAKKKSNIQRYIFEELNNGGALPIPALLETVGCDPDKPQGFHKQVSNMKVEGWLVKIDNSELVKLTDICFPRGRPLPG